MSDYRQLLYHIVFRTHDSKSTIKKDNAEQLYAYIQLPAERGRLFRAEIL